MLAFECFKWRRSLESLTVGKWRQSYRVNLFRMTLFIFYQRAYDELFLFCLFFLRIFRTAIKFTVFEGCHQRIILNVTSKIFLTRTKRFRSFFFVLSELVEHANELFELFLVSQIID